MAQLFIPRNESGESASVRAMLVVEVAMSYSRVMHDALKSFFLQPFSLKNYLKDCWELAVLLLKIFLALLPFIISMAAVFSLLAPILLLWLLAILILPAGVFLLFLR
jgi:hypothetical protein